MALSASVGVLCESAGSLAVPPTFSKIFPWSTWQHSRGRLGARGMVSWISPCRGMEGLCVGVHELDDPVVKEARAEKHVCVLSVHTVE